MLHSAVNEPGSNLGGENSAHGNVDTAAEPVFMCSSAVEGEQHGRDVGRLVCEDDIAAGLDELEGALTRRHRRDSCRCAHVVGEDQSCEA